MFERETNGNRMIFYFENHNLIKHTHTRARARAHVYKHGNFNINIFKLL